MTKHTRSLSRTQKILCIEMWTNFQDSVRTLSADSAFTKEFGKKFTKIEVSNGKKKSVTAKDKTLQIVYPAEGSKYERFSIADLEEGFNKVL